jgi:tRNA threonylcarbamoyladenosine biosynthesis protein TsaB
MVLPLAPDQARLPAYALPVVGVSTLLALAHATGEKKVIACLDARMSEVYFAAYEYQEDAWLELSPPALYKPDQLPVLKGDSWVGVGSGWDAYPEQLQVAYGAQITTWYAGKFPQASAMAEIALSEFLAGRGLPAAQAAPIYVRNKVAFTTQEREKLAVR